MIYIVNMDKREAFLGLFLISVKLSNLFHLVLVNVERSIRPLLGVDPSGRDSELRFISRVRHEWLQGIIGCDPRILRLTDILIDLLVRALIDYEHIT